MAKTNNEGRALDAVLRFIEAGDQAPRANDGRSPDDPKHPDSDRLRRVDYVCTVGQTLYAFEHTRIEPFTNQIESGVHDEKFFDPILERFSHRADKEIWDLYVRVGASAGLSGRKARDVQDALIKWIEANSGRIPVVPRWGRHGDTLSWESAGDIPFPFSLRRTVSQGSASGFLGKLLLRPIAPDGLEEQRVARLRKACEDKLPKLAKWKQDPGARTILVLEEDDLSLTNHFRVADALSQAEATTPDAPDEVFLVSTCIEQTWWVVCLRGLRLVDGEPFPHSEFDPMELTKLTSR
jgi:hypothetical protein